MKREIIMAVKWRVHEIHKKCWNLLVYFHLAGFHPALSKEKKIVDSNNLNISDGGIADELIQQEGLTIRWCWILDIDGIVKNFFIFKIVDNWNVHMNLVPIEAESAIGYVFIDLYWIDGKINLLICEIADGWYSGH